MKMKFPIPPPDHCVARGVRLSSLRVLFGHGITIGRNWVRSPFFYDVYESKRFFTPVFGRNADFYGPSGGKSVKTATWERGRFGQGINWRKPGPSGVP
jgi:hypothetical protein